MTQQTLVVGVIALACIGFFCDFLGRMAYAGFDGFLLDASFWGS